MHKRFKKVIALVFIGLAYSTDISNSRQTALTRAIEKIGPAVASINVQSHTIKRLRIFGPFYTQEKYPMKTSGSGFVISPDGFLLTNNHVIATKYGYIDNITVTLTGGNEYAAEIIGRDEITDIALLKLEGSNFPYVELGNSDNLIIGEWVIALGNPFELFTVSNKPSASVGIISATDMDFGIQNSMIFQDMIQTDAAIFSGNSGGPLVNSLGEVIGINTFVFKDNYPNQVAATGIGFAIPINNAVNIAKELRTAGKVERQWDTGLILKNVTYRMARKLNLPFSQGIMVDGIKKGSAAEKSGLKRFDIILAVETELMNEKIMKTENDLGKYLRANQLRPGDKISLRIYRKYPNEGDNYKKFTLTLDR